MSGALRRRTYTSSPSRSTSSTGGGRSPRPLTATRSVPPLPARTFTDPAHAPITSRPRSETCRVSRASSSRDSKLIGNATIHPLLGPKRPDLPPLTGPGASWFSPIGTAPPLTLSGRRCVDVGVRFAPAGESERAWSDPSSEGRGVPEPQIDRSAGGEADLVRRAAEGDVGSYETLYRKHVGRVHALCLRMARDRSEADDLTQETFIRVWERLGSFRGESAFSTWLHRVAVNVVVAELRSRGRWRERFTAQEAEDVVAEPAFSAGGDVDL